jgi:hypothetical protein
MKAGIRSLAVRLPLLAVGSYDGTVGLFRLEGSSQGVLLVKYHEDRIENAEVTERVNTFASRAMDYTHEIQSLSIDEKFVLIGTKNGNIYEICLEDRLRLVKRLNHHDQ